MRQFTMNPSLVEDTAVAAEEETTTEVEEAVASTEEGATTDRQLYPKLSDSATS